MENTIIKNLTFTKSDSDSNEYYHKQPGISASDLKQVKQSPAHYKYEEIEQTPAMYFGAMYHTFILENDKFYKEYTVVDAAARPDQKHGMSAIANKLWFGAFDNPITSEVHEQLKAMREVLFRHPYAKSLLTGGEVERSYYCDLDIGSEKPLQVRFRPDNVKHNKRIVVDLKTAADASQDGFKTAAAKYDYQIQAALYADLMELIMDEPMGYQFFFVAQEKKVPYAFNIFEASPQFRSVGRYEYEILLMLYAYCSEQDKWPGYQVFIQNRFGVNSLDLPTWSIKELEYYLHKL